MNNELFEELEQSVREMGAINRSEMQPSRVTELSSSLKQPLDNRKEAQKNAKTKQETT